MLSSSSSSSSDPDPDPEAEPASDESLLDEAIADDMAEAFIASFLDYLDIDC